jgi:hypothetical protein
MGTTKKDTERLIAQIRAFRKLNRTDEEIRAALKLHIRTFQRLNKKIREIDRQLWFSITKHELEPTLLKFMRTLEDIYIRAEKLANADDTDGETVLNALHIMAETRLNQVQLLTEGPELMSDMQRAQQDKHKGQNKIMMQATQHHP